MTEDEHRRGYAICECGKYAFVWRSELLRYKPKDYHGECCEECGQWTCSVAVAQECERQMLLARQEGQA